MHGIFHIPCTARPGSIFRKLTHHFLENIFQEAQVRKKLKSHTGYAPAMPSIVLKRKEGLNAGRQPIASCIVLHVVCQNLAILTQCMLHACSSQLVAASALAEKIR